MSEDQQAAKSAGASPAQPISEEDREYIRWMTRHIERELEDALWDWNINGDDSYFKELDKRYEAGFFNTDLFGYNPEWDEGDDAWSTRAMALKIAKDLFKRRKGLEWE
jgi:hypothetical protein